MASLVPFERHVALLTDLWAHLASYASGLNACEQHAINVEQRLRLAYRSFEKQLPLRFRESEIMMGVMPRDTPAAQV